MSILKKKVTIVFYSVSIDDLTAYVTRPRPWMRDHGCAKKQQYKIVVLQTPPPLTVIKAEERLSD